MQFKFTKFATVLIASGIISLPTVVHANDSAELEELRSLVQELDQKIRVLDRKGELAEVEVQKEKAKAPVVKANSGGFSIGSADGAHVLKLRGLVQFDNRSYFGDNNPSIKNDNLFRRIRPRIQGTFFNIFDLDLNAEFAKDSATIQDATIDARFQPWFQVKVGKFKAPLSLERQQSGSWIRFAERSYVADSLAPNRDVGIEIHGGILDKKVSYELGVFNGTGDGGTGSQGGDTNTDKEFAARVFAEPFKGSDSVLAGLGVGLAGTWGDESGESASAKYRTPGAQTFFSYNAATLSDGKKTRWSPQAYYYYGPFGVIAEYARSSTDVIRGARKANLDNDAWQVAASWVLTGEDNSFGAINPKSNYEPNKSGWGAWEIAARYHQLEVDKDAFTGTNATRFAGSQNLATGVNVTKKAQTWTLGLNWYLNKNVKIATSYDHTSFDSAIAGIKDRENEKALFTRLQIAY
ncbi:MAG: porin [Methylotenera sp.]|nr:porin [Methylotenera sp.]